MLAYNISYMDPMGIGAVLPKKPSFSNQVWSLESPSVVSQGGHGPDGPDGPDGSDNPEMQMSTAEVGMGYAGSVWSATTLWELRPSGND